MKNFLLVFRMDSTTTPKRSPAEAEAMTKRWMDWIGSIASQNKLADRGNRLDNSGRVVKGNDVVTNGPYCEIKESIGGYSIIKAETYDEAVSLAKGCPALAQGGSVEVREISVL